MGKCLKDVQGVTLKVVQWDLLGDPLGENRGTRGMKIRIMNKRKSGPTLERGCTKPIRQYRVLQGTGNLTIEMRNLSGCTDW